MIDRSNVPSARTARQGDAVRGAALALLLVIANTPASAQQRSMAQDPARDNLTHPAGYEPAEPGTLGRVERVGTGPRAMILVAGLGFGGDVFRAFMDAHADAFTMYAVTLPGFGGTPAPPNPAPETSFGAQFWTNGAARGVRRLMRDEGLDRPILVGHWLGGTQVALRVALQDPDAVGAVVLISGSAKFVPTDGAARPAPATLEQRIAGVDHFMAPRWFRTVTRDTWDDNNFLPGDYARHPVRALQLWRQAAKPPLHVWVPWLCEFFAQDISLELPALKVATLVLRPGFDEDHFVEPGMDYMRAYTHASWRGADANPLIELRTVENSRMSILDDQPEELAAAVREFAAAHR